ncbi:MAG: hypothetical protein R6X16_17695 [Anaerolineae bacterium]
MNNRHSLDAVEEDISGADTEMARHLLGLRQSPSLALEARVGDIPFSSQRRNRLIPRGAWALATVALTITVLVSTSQPLRAAMSSLRVTIGNVILTSADRSPYTGDATIVAPELMSLQASRTAVPFDFSIPTRVPDGWVMDDQVRVNDLGSGPFVELVWTNAGRGNLTLSARSVAQAHGLSTSTLVGTSDVREVEIGGQPAALVTGGWDHDSREWAWPEVMTLYWTSADTEYALSTSDPAVTEAELMAMAESAQ